MRYYTIRVATVSTKEQQCVLRWADSLNGSTTFMRRRLCAGTFRRRDFYAPGLLCAGTFMRRDFYAPGLLGAETFRCQR